MSFCNEMNYCPVPITQTTLLRYTVYLATRLAPQSIPAYLNVIRLLHLDSNLPNPVENNFGLNMLLKGIKRDKGIVINQALPELLLSIKGLTACLVAFFAKSNLFYNTDNDQVVINSGGQVVLVINSSKTIQYKQRSVILPLPEIVNHPLCPVSALKHMYKLCPSQEGSKPVFMVHTHQG